MPFVQMQGGPHITSMRLMELREQVTAVVADKMECSQNWVRVFFPKDELEQFPQINCSTIWVKLETALFTKKLKEGVPEEKVKALVQMVMESIVETIWNFHGGNYEVEIAVVHLDKESMFLKMPRK